MKGTPMRRSLTALSAAITPRKTAAALFAAAALGAGIAPAVMSVTAAAAPGAAVAMHYEGGSAQPGMYHD